MNVNTRKIQEEIDDLNREQLPGEMRVLLDRLNRYPKDTEGFRYSMEKLVLLKCRIARELNDQGEGEGND